MKAKTTKGLSQSAPACTVQGSVCLVCGSVHKKPWSNKAPNLCKHGCFVILSGHIAFNGMRKRVKFFTAAAVPLMAKYSTYDKLMAAGRVLDANLRTF